MQRATILDFKGTWGSGIAMLSLQVGNGMKLDVPCENAQTVRALDSCFGGVISPGHGVNVEAIKGKEIYFGLDDLGMLEGFSLVNEMEVN